MSLWPPHAPICHLWMRDMHNIVHTVATIAKLPEKALKITLICDFNRVVLHQYCMYGFRDRESGLEKGRSWLCQWVGDLVAIQCREEEERGKCVFLPNEIGKNGDLGRLKTWDFSVKITIGTYSIPCFFWTFSGAGALCESRGEMPHSRTLFRLPAFEYFYSLSNILFFLYNSSCLV